MHRELAVVDRHSEGGFTSLMLVSRGIKIFVIA